MTKSKKKESAGHFLRGVQYKDLHKIFRKFMWGSIIVNIVMFGVTIWALLLASGAVLKQNQVAVLIDKEGVFHKMKLSPFVEANREMVKSFVGNFFNSIEGAHPQMEKKQLKALNMMTGKFRRIFVSSPEVSEHLNTQVERFQKGNTISTYSIRDVNFKKTDFELGGHVTLSMTGYIDFGPVTVPRHVEYERVRKYFYVEASVIVRPLLPEDLNGFAVDYYFSRLFNTQQELDGYILEKGVFDEDM